MSLSIRLEPAAKRELFEAMKWYESREDGLGTEFLESARDAMERAAERPAMFPTLRGHDNVRRRVLRRFPYMPARGFNVGTAVTAVTAFGSSASRSRLAHGAISGRST